MSGASTREHGRSRIAPIIPATLRTLAADLRSGADLPALIKALGRALEAVPPLRGFTVEAPVGVSEFDVDRISVPLLGAGGTLGTMKIAPGGSGTFRTSRLHLAGALADVAAVIIDHALVARSRSAPAEMISVALADLPVGVLCFDGSGMLVFANPAAHQALAGRIPADWAAVWTALAPEGRRQSGSSFVLRGGSRLVHVTARRTSATGPGAVVLVDLSIRVNGFNEVLSGEVYRSLVEKVPLCLGVVAGDEGSPAALEALELARASLPAGARVGPVDGEAIGILVSGPSAGSLWPVMHGMARAIHGAEVLRGGVTSLRQAGDTPGALLARATIAMRPLQADARPGLLVCDRAPAVNETLALILRRDFSVSCSGGWAQSLALLQEQPFDGLVVELPARGDEEAADFVRRAIAIQPAARPFFVTDQPAPWETGEFGSPDAPVFRKPFVVRDVRTAFKSAFAGSSA